MERNEIRTKAAQIVYGLKGMSGADCVLILSAALEMIVDSESIDPIGLSDPHSEVSYRVPRRIERHSFYEDVWRYLETVDEYESLKKLRKKLVKKFGEANTPSKSTLSRHFIRNGRSARERASKKRK